MATDPRTDPTRHGGRGHGHARASAPPAEARARPDGARTALAADLRAAVPDGLAALAVTASVFGFLFLRVRSGESATLEVMPDLADAGEYWMYWLSQAFGWAGLLWAYLTVALGLLVAGQRPGRLRVSPRTLERWHRTTSLNTLVLMTGHAVMFFAELVRYEAALGWGDRLLTGFVDTFVPGGYSSGTGRLAIPIGQAALYLAALLGLSFYLRRRIGPRTWRTLHRLVVVTYALSVWHTLLYGTNVWFDGWPRTTLWALQLPLLALLLARLLRPVRRGERLGAGAWPARLATGAAVLAVALTMVAVVAVLATGRDGGRARPEPAPAGALTRTASEGDVGESRGS
ncbi:ferric reductase-like transmembrane domain-containing protein [Allostreptomyces psammosilenae]|uniref:Ferric oxidoreductase domain-containing protein n=1 Tax=Allostreptomyces psammosilenae TaxID=1892865 RepID=A0A852ZP00_9ACTN|nr:ferric reductase-like transmembrane domain-containing protein [Allostreptomyces psammosilenae]NYI04123.1 hypothetical protein [Allostreptomyces psammosilenae]